VQTELASLLQAGDTNGDGKLSPTEIAQLPEYQRELLKQGDSDGDEHLDAAELVLLIRERNKSSTPETGIGGGGGE
jgi:Ca2+-binding EF-hand superfamily protein